MNLTLFLAAVGDRLRVPPADELEEITELVMTELEGDEAEAEALEEKVFGPHGDDGETGLLNAFVPTTTIIPRDCRYVGSPDGVLSACRSVLASSGWVRDLGWPLVAELDKQLLSITRFSDRLFAIGNATFGPNAAPLERLENQIEIGLAARALLDAYKEHDVEAGAVAATRLALHLAWGKAIG